jgi:protein required for attachment to host cells
LISEHEHPASRKRDRDLVTDKQGKFGSGTFEEQTDPKRHEEETFAIELARDLTKAHENYQELILIASPVFMGLIHKHLPNTVSKLVTLTIEKDYTYCTKAEIAAHLQKYL